MKIKRTIHFSIIFIILISIVGFTFVNATSINGREVIDYRQYTTSLITENGLTTITNVFKPGMGDWFLGEVGVIHGISFDSGAFTLPYQYYLYRYPLGYNKCIDLNRLPKGAKIDLEMLYETTYPKIQETKVDVRIACFDENMKDLGIWTIKSDIAFPEGGDTLSTSVSVNDTIANFPSGTRYINPFFCFKSYTGSKKLHAIAGDFTLLFRFYGFYSQSDAAYREEEYWNSVEEGLLQSGQIKLPDDEPITDMEDLENDLTGKSGEVKDSISDIIKDALSFVDGLRPAFDFVADIIGYALTRVPILGGLIYLSLGLGIFASIVNIVSVAIRNSGGKDKGGSK